MPPTCLSCVAVDNVWVCFDFSLCGWGGVGLGICVFISQENVFLLCDWWNFFCCLLPNHFCLWFPSFWIINVVNVHSMYGHSGYFKKNSFSFPCSVYFYTVFENLSIFDKFIYFCVNFFKMFCPQYLHRCCQWICTYILALILPYCDICGNLLRFLFSFKHDCKTMSILMFL